MTDPPKARRVPALAVASSALMMFALGSLYAWSIFVGPLEEIYGASRSAVSAVFSFATVCFAGTMVVGTRSFRFAPAWVLAFVTCLLAAIGLALAGTGLSLWAVGLGYGGLFGIANGIGYGLSVQVVNTALPERRGLVTGVAVACYTGGAAVFAFLFEAGIHRMGANATFLVMALVMLLVGAAAGAMLHGSGIVLPDGTGTAGGGTGGQRHVFWSLWVGFFCGALAGLMALGHAASLVASLGGSARELGLGAAAVAIGNTIGRLSGGAACDRFSARHVLIVVSLICVIGLGLLLLQPAVALAIASLALVGIGYGSMAGAYPVITSYFFGASNAAFVYGRLFTAWGAAGLIAPYLAGYLFDTLGQYSLAIALAAVAMAIAIVAHLTLPRGHWRMG